MRAIARELRRKLLDGSSWLVARPPRARPPLPGRRAVRGALAALAVATAVGCGQGTRRGSGTDDTVTGTGGGQPATGAGGASSGDVAAITAGPSVTGSGGGPECERELSFEAVILGEPAPFDLIVVADHSDSLGFSRDELAQGLSDLLDGVRGRHVRVFLLTPTQYGASSAPAQYPQTGEPVVAWQDPATGEAYEPAMTTYSQSCTDLDRTPIDCPDPRAELPYLVVGTWEFAMPPPIAELTPEQTEAEFQAQEQALADAILSIRGKGSPHEQPLCTLARYIFQDPELLPSNAVFLVLSDEDDGSTPAECLKGFEAGLTLVERDAGSEACSSDCDGYLYSIPGENYWERLEYHCAAFDDVGMMLPGTENSDWDNVALVDSCAEVSPGPCSDAEWESVARNCDVGTEVFSCERQCYTNVLPCQVQLPDASVDACTEAFVYNGIQYKDLPEYCALIDRPATGACTSSGFNELTSTSLTSSQRLTQVTPGFMTEHLAHHVLQEAESQFGEDNFLVEAIVHDPSFSCELGAGQSYATNLSRIVADSRHLFPLCESYAPALASVLGFAQALTQTEFLLQLEEGESINQVLVEARDGAQRELPTTSWTYDDATGTLRIDRSVITGTDSRLNVEVTSACIPIIE